MAITAATSFAISLSVFFGTFPFINASNANGIWNNQPKPIPMYRFKVLAFEAESILKKANKPGLAQQFDTLSNYYKWPLTTEKNRMISTASFLLENMKNMDKYVAERNPYWKEEFGILAQWQEMVEILKFEQYEWNDHFNAAKRDLLREDNEKI